MTAWNAGQYLKFENERTQPARDLASRISAIQARNALDIGCGPGNSTQVLRETFPTAVVQGVDSSDAMIEKARVRYPDLTFAQGDARSLNGCYDVLFSNACLQWVPDHRALLPHLMRCNLNEGGVLAVQMPMNGEEPLFRIIRETADNPRWDVGDAANEVNGTLSPDEYFDILSGCASAFQIWETTYYHVLAGHEALIEWVRGTRLRPYLARLSAEEGAKFEAEILEKARKVYPLLDGGRVILRFRRFFFTAVK